MRAVKTFICSAGKIRVKVRVLPTIIDVHHAFGSKRGLGLTRGSIVNAYFDPMQTPEAKYVGTIVLPLDGRLAELIPHEVTHAVVRAMGGVLPRDDEAFCDAVGVLSARIMAKMGRAA